MCKVHMLTFLGLGACQWCMEGDQQVCPSPECHILRMYLRPLCAGDLKGPRCRPLDHLLSNHGLLPKNRSAATFLTPIKVLWPRLPRVQAVTYLRVGRNLWGIPGREIFCRTGYWLINHVTFKLGSLESCSFLRYFSQLGEAWKAVGCLSLKCWSWKNRDRLLSMRER